METTKDMYYIKYDDCNKDDALIERVVFADNEEYAISAVDSLYSAGYKNIVITNHRNEKRDISQEGCMWHFMGETVDHDYVYCMYMNEFNQGGCK